MTPQKTLLALSWSAARVPVAGRRELADSAARTIRRLTGVEAAVRADLEDGLVLVTERSERDRAPADGLVVTLSLGARTLDGRLLDAAALGARLAAGSVADVAPPFAACAVTDPPGTVVAATDSAGLRHVYHVQRPGWAAVSTSSLLLAVLAGAGFDEEAIGTSSLIGNYLGERTPFDGVGVLPAGALAKLSAGTVDVLRTPPAVAPGGSLGRADAVAGGVGVVRDLVAACLRAYPEPLIELSGGLDSRMVLAAIPRERRPGLRAVTIGPAGSADQRIAARIAALEGLRHEAVTLDAIGALAPAALAALVTSASLTRDCTGNPLALAVLDWQERALDQGPRLTGQNGEFARGFYYAGQRAHPAATGDLVDRLARWRLFVNEAADPALFTPGFLEDVRSSALRGLRREFASYPGDWLAATDEFYVRERMRRWVGISYSWACTRRVVQSPFFHPAYLEWARACAPADRRGSRVFAEVLTALDPGLAALPLDGGRTPGAIATPTRADRLAGARTTVRKVVRKVDQRLRGTGRPASGAALVGSRVQAAWAAREGALEAVARLPFLDAVTVEQVARGARPVNPASVALLVNLDAALRAARGAPA